MERLERDLNAVRFMPMVEERSREKAVRSLRREMNRLSAWFYGAPSLERKLKEWHRKERRK